MFKKFTFKKKKENKGAVFAVGAVIGGLLGSVAAVFLTPINGKKARETVASKTKKGVNWVSKEVGTKKDQLVKSTSNVASKLDNEVKAKKTEVLNATSKIAAETERGIQTKIKEEKDSDTK